MWYALVRSYDEYCGDGCHRLFFGSLPEIAHALVDQCSSSVMWEDIGDSSLAEFEEDNGDLNSLRAVYENPSPSEEDIRNFDFYYSGEHVCVISLTNTYSALVEAFNKYAEDHFCGKYQMAPGDITDPIILGNVDDDLVRIHDRPSPYFIKIEE